MEKKPPLHVVRTDSGSDVDEFGIDQFMAEINRRLLDISAKYISDEYSFRVGFHKGNVSDELLRCSWVHEVFKFERFLFERNKEIIRNIFERYEISKTNAKHLERMWEIFENNFNPPESYLAQGISYNSDFFPK